MRVTHVDQLILITLQDIKDLKDAKRTMSPKEICMKLNMPYSTVAVSLRKLCGLKCAEKHSGGASGGFRYSFKSATPDTEAYRQALALKQVKPPNVLASKQGIRLEYNDIYSLLKRWSQEKWEPKAFRSARKLPLSVAAMVELVAQMAYGSDVDNEDLYENLKQLERFQTDLKTVLGIVEGILRDPRFRDPNKFYTFLFSNGSVEELQELARLTREKN